MSVTTSNFQYQTLKWREKVDSNNLLMTSGESDQCPSSNVDDGLTSLSWLQNLNMCMTRLGAPTPPTPPASPVCFGFSYSATTLTSNSNTMQSTPNSASVVSQCKSDISTKLDIGNEASREACITATPKNVTSNRNGAFSQKSTNTFSQPLSPVAPEAASAIAKTDSSKKKSPSSHAKSGSPKQNKKQSTQPQYSQSPHSHQEPVDYKSNGNIKPPYSYATLICMAMKANKNKMTLSSIYKWIKENFLYYRNADPSWQNSIRHNLSLNKCFIKIPRNKDEPGKGGFWKLDPIYADTLVDGVFKKRRPSQKGGQNGDAINERPVPTKKSRKKAAAESSAMDTTAAATATALANANYVDIRKVQQETPPSSAESYNYKEKLVDANELVRAVRSIDDNNCTYTIHTANIVDCDQNNLCTVHGYANEICISNSVSNECIIESDGNDICWNAILTDADLNELVNPINYTDSVAQIIPIEADIQSSTGPNTTAQLTAVEPHDLDIIATSTNLLEDQQLFYQTNQLQNISFQSNPSHIIAATSNVVTCINDDNITSHWNDWNPYNLNTTSMQMECSNRSAGILLSQLESGHNQISMAQINVINEPSISYIATTAPLQSSSSDTLTLKHATMTSAENEPNISSQSIDANSHSPTHFQTINSLQPWVKEELDTSALDLDHFANLEPMQQF